MDQTQYGIDTQPDSREVERLKDRIDTFNVDETKIDDFKELAIFLRDAAAQMFARLYAYTRGGIGGNHSDIFCREVYEMTAGFLFKPL